VRVIATTSLVLLVVLTKVPLLFGQQVAFTSRVHLQAPVLIASTQESKVYGFDSVELRADAGPPVKAVRLKVTFRTGAGEEITDDHRFVVDLASRESKRLIVDLGHIQGLKQLAQSRHQESGLAILSVVAVEFDDGSVWEDSGPVEGMPVLPVNLPKK
jgi:hypothetical protein